jgi:hypothetical protein
MFISLVSLGLSGCQAVQAPQSAEPYADSPESNAQPNIEPNAPSVESNTRSSVDPELNSIIDTSSSVTDQLTGADNPMNTLSIDFSDINSWYVINDNVMGGISEGGMQQEDPGVGLFKGQLSLENRGGFSSVRTSVKPTALTEASGLQLRVRGEEGRLFTLLVASETMNGSWQKDFSTSSEWETIHIHFDSMQFYIRGWMPPSAPRINPEEIDIIGLMIKDKNEEAFRLEVDWIRADYRDQE